MWILYPSTTSSRWTCNWLCPRLIRPGGGLLLAGAILLLAGCSSGKADKTFKEIVFRPNPQRAVLSALQEENPDTRRRYLRSLIKRDELKQDWCIKALDVLARTDDDAQVRCIALQGLAKSGRAQGIDTALAILNPRTTTRPVRSGEDNVRLDSLTLLAGHLQAHTVPADRMDDVRQVFYQAAVDESYLQARMAAVRGLRYFPRPETLQILLDVMGESAFALKYEAEMSLRSLTGYTGDFEADTWQTWLAAHQEDAFAGRDAHLQVERSRDTLWRRTTGAFSDMWTAWQGPSKPTGKPSPTSTVKQAEGQRMIMEASE